MSAEVKTIFLAVICLNMVSLIIFVSDAKNRMMADLRSFEHMENTRHVRNTDTKRRVDSIKTESVIKTKHSQILKGEQQKIRHPFSQYEKEVAKMKASAQTSENTRKCNGVKDKLNIKESDTFWNSEREPHLHIRSAYLDYRFEKPVVQFLTIMGHNLSDSIICHFAYNRPCKEIVANVQSSLTDLFKNDRTKCFYLQVTVKCPFSPDEPPDYVAVSTNSTGYINQNNSLNFIDLS